MAYVHTDINTQKGRSFLEIHYYVYMCQGMCSNTSADLSINKSNKTRESNDSLNHLEKILECVINFISTKQTLQSLP